MFNPYGSLIPQSTGLLGRGLSFSSILSNAQKTLNIVNQTIPLVYQIKPIFKNARTMFKVAKEFTNTNNTNNNQKYIDNTNNITYKSDNGPSFFI